MMEVSNPPEYAKITFSFAMCVTSHEFNGKGNRYF